MSANGPRVIKGVAELEQIPAGEVLGASEWLEITQDRINQFADATNDHQWIHVDIEKAKAGPFGAPIAHGFLTLSLIPGFTPDIVDIQGMKMKINYGLNKVRFAQPVVVGSKLRDVVTMGEVTKKSSGIQVTMTHTIEIEGAERPACVAETVSLMVPED